jgi:hypothetical protein
LKVYFFSCYILKLIVILPVFRNPSISGIYVKIEMVHNGKSNDLKGKKDYKQGITGEDK